MLPQAENVMGLPRGRVEAKDISEFLSWGLKLLCQNCLLRSLATRDPDLGDLEQTSG